MAKEFSFGLTVDRQNVYEAVKGLLWTVFFYRTFGSIIPKTTEFLEIPYPSVEDSELEQVFNSKIESLIARIDSNTETPLLTSTSSTPLGSPPNLKFINTVNNNPYSNIRFNDQTIEEEIEDQTITTSSTNTTDFLSNSIQGSVKSPILNAQLSNAKFTQIVINFYELKKLKKPTWFGKIEEEVNFETWLINIRVLKNNHNEDLKHSIAKQFENLVWDISETANNNKDHIPTITSTDVLPFNYSIAIKSNANNESWKEFITKMLKDPINN